MDYENIDIRKILQEKGEKWVISAMVEGSIGYHSPDHAKLLIQKYLNGEKKDYCERCIACFNSDLEKMIKHDIYNFLWMEKHSPDKVQKILNFVEKWSNLNTVEQTQIGLMYPTIVL